MGFEGAKYKSWVLAYLPKAVPLILSLGRHHIVFGGALSSTRALGSGSPIL